MAKKMLKMVKQAATMRKEMIDNRP